MITANEETHRQESGCAMRLELRINLSRKRDLRVTWLMRPHKKNTQGPPELRTFIRQYCGTRTTIPGVEK